MDLSGLSGYRFADSQWSFGIERALALADALGQVPNDARLPPTLAFSADLDGRIVDQLLQLTGLGAHQLLHGEQHFHYHRSLQADARYRVCGVLVDVQRKSHFQLLHKHTRLLDERAEPVCEMTSIYVAIEAPEGPKRAPSLALDLGDGWPGALISHERIAAFAAASGDDNPVHLDPAIARQAGHPDVFAQGMLGMGLLAGHIPPGNLQRFGVRFVSPIPVNEQPRLHLQDGASPALFMTGKDGQLRIKGYAHVTD